MEADTILSMRNIGKEYYGNVVLKDVSLDIKKGEIHALLGENGAGKSTLMNILFGMEVIHTTGGYAGEIFMDGKKVVVDSPRKAMELGIGMVHQEFMLIPGFTVTENIKIGREISKPSFFSRFFGKKLENLDMPAMAADARKNLDRVGLSVDEYDMVAGMPVGYMQFVEIAREIDKSGIKLLVFDEPTAVLTESEALRLMDAMQRLAQSGIAIIFITHRLDEVMAVCDTITILRDGELVAVRDKRKTNVRELAQLMVGRSLDSSIQVEKPARDISDEQTALQLRNFTVAMDGEEVRGLDLTVRKGEIFGIGGLAGQGKIGVCNGIMSLAPAGGEAAVFGEPLQLGKLGEALHKKIAFVSEDRRGVGLLLDESIAHNITFSASQVVGRFLSKIGPFTQRSKAMVNEFANRMIGELDIRCTGPRQPAGALSGGNQQKVCLAKALALDPKLLMVSEPTRGIDIGAKKNVLDMLVKLNAEEGMTIIMVSSELAELRSVCDRIAIITDGRLAAIMKPDDSDADFGLAMSGTFVEGGNRNGQQEA